VGRAKVHKRDGDPVIGLPYFYGGQWAIVDRILRPADLPVQARTKDELCHQSKDCQGTQREISRTACGISKPARADEVIE
jgi:hypothetical protein